MKSISLSLLFFVVYTFTNAQLISFPSAEGFGKFTSGGRGTTFIAPTIYEVTKLTDDGTAGTFRYACTNNSPAAANRIVVFRVSGTIHLNSVLSLTRANITIAGQTAPGDGICIADYPVYLGASNIIIRYLRFRLGDKNQLVTTPANCGIPVAPFSANPSCIPTANVSGNDDAFGDNGGGRTNIIIDHCSMSWSNDEAFTIYKGNNVTLQWNFISEPLNFSYHVEPGDANYEQHAYGGIWGGAATTAHHNLLAHCKGRMPRFDGTRNIPNELVDFRNNVIYNWGDYNTNGGEGGNYNVVNNYYKFGPSTPSTITSGVNRRNMIINPSKSATASITTYGKFYLTGNYCDNSSAVTSDNWLGSAFGSGTPTAAELTAIKQTNPFAVQDINMETAQAAYNAVLQKAGCSLPNRDTLDARIVNDVIFRTGSLIDCQGNNPHATPYSTSQTAWPTLASGIAQLDTDHDGMTDIWEDARGLNRILASDRNGYISTSGYNNVENYINGDTITAVGVINSCITSKNINCSNSSTWLFARDSTYSNYLSSTYTSAVDSNLIVAAVLDNGNFGNFAVSYYTTNALRIDAVTGKPYLNRNITITPQNPALITAPVTVRIYISKKELDDLKLADPSIININDVNVLKVIGANCADDLAATYSVITPSATGIFGTYDLGYFIEFQTSSFSTFYVGSKISFLAPLPLKLLAFDAQLKNDKVLATWATSNELNTASFSVEKSSNTQQYFFVGNINAYNTAGEHSYNFIDENLLKGISYYRLKSIDMDGKFSYSPIKKIFNNKESFLKIFPDPVNDNFTLLHPVALQHSFIKILNYNGAVVLKYNPITGSISSSINVTALALGTYTIVFYNDKNIFSSTFLHIN